ncbi:MAG: hypothetical protein HYS36_01800 [Candidatus Rokubacteria bacterium]|nr:hypothetical protein [Candidatus Rokubacteria bacterium]
MPQRYFSAHGVDAVAELFIRDITRGIGDSGVKAAIIKCATDTASRRSARPASPKVRSTRCWCATRGRSSRPRGAEAPGLSRRAAAAL